MNEETWKPDDITAATAAGRSHSLHLGSWNLGMFPTSAVICKVRPIIPADIQAQLSRRRIA